MAGVDDVVSSIKTGVTNLANLAGGMVNAYPPPTATVSPAATGLNALGTTAATIAVASSTTRHGIIFHNPGTTSVYVYPTAIATAPTVSAVGGAFLILPAGTLKMSSDSFPNVNCGWSAFAGAGSAQPLTIVEFF